MTLLKMPLVSIMILDSFLKNLPSFYDIVSQYPTLHFNADK